jgi:hypothetical protein
MLKKFLTAFIALALSMPTGFLQQAYAAEFKNLSLTITWDEETFYQPSGCTSYTFGFQKSDERTIAMIRIENKYGDILKADAIYSGAPISGKKSMIICDGKDFTDTKLVLDVRYPESDIKSIPILFKVRGASPAQSASTTAPTTPGSIENETCSKGGKCKVGDLGPGGGIIVFVSPSVKSWGDYIEAAPAGWDRGRLDPEKQPYCSSQIPDPTNLSFDIGGGLSNSRSIKKICPNGAVAEAMAYKGNGLNDWFLPSISELGEMYQARKSIGLEEKYNYWSSTVIEYGYIRILYDGGRLGINLLNNDSAKIRPIRYGKFETGSKNNAIGPKSIICTKGKLTKKVTAVNPKCPAGYKKK